MRTYRLYNVLFDHDHNCINLCGAVTRLNRYRGAHVSRYYMRDAEHVLRSIYNCTCLAREGDVAKRSLGRRV